jgi:hypothetical protein
MPANVDLWLLLGFPPISWRGEDDAWLRAWARSLAFSRAREGNDLPRVLGAPTFRIQLADKDGVVAWDVIWRGGIVTTHGLVAVDNDNRLLEWPQLQQLTLDRRLSAPMDILRAPLPTVSQPILDVPASVDRTPLCRAAPADDWAGKWIDHPLKNNCYNYANDVGVDESRPWPAIPGRGGGCEEIEHNTTVQQIQEACTCDGLELLLRLPDACPHNGHFVAVIVRPERHDFHCFRLNRNLVWSHKDGSDVPTSDDDDGQPIRDLGRARFRYSFRFAGFFFSPTSRTIG